MAYVLFCCFGCLVLLPSIILYGFLGLLKISCQAWQPGSVIGVTGISGASGSVVGVEPDSVDTDLDGVGVILGVGRPNSDCLESVEESF